MDGEARGGKRPLLWLVVAAAIAAAAAYVVLGRRAEHAPEAPAAAAPHAPNASPRAAARPGATAGGAERQKLSVGVLPNGESDLVYLAAALGAFDAEGLDVELAPFDRGRRGLASLKHGGVDVATAGDVGLATEDFSRSEYAVFATIGHAEEHLIVVGRKDRGVAAPADLKGKRVGIDARMNARYLTHRFLAAHGLTERDLEIVEMKLKKLPGALGRGEIDAIVDPFSDDHPSTRRMTSSPSVELVTLTEPGSYRISFHALASRAFVEKSPAALRAFVRALLRALDYARAHKEEAEHTVAEALAVGGDRVAEEWSHTDFDVSLDRGIVDGLDEIDRWARAAGHARRPGEPSFSSMIYPDALVAERPEAVHLSAAAQ